MKIKTNDKRENEFRRQVSDVRVVVQVGMLRISASGKLGQ